MRTIDADAFDATMYEAWKNNEITNEEWIHFREMIKDEPTIEPQRMRGKWVDGHRMRLDGTFYWYRMCSECGYERDDDNIDMDTNFCPDCGAEMEGAEE